VVAVKNWRIDVTNKNELYEPKDYESVSHGKFISHSNQFRQGSWPLLRNLILNLIHLYDI